jgi:glycosyltransferase involved in cell wall biosynthesis
MESSNHPKVSFNVPVYNGEKTVARTIQSLLAQSFTDFEVVVVNDASKDSTPQILNEFKDPRVRIIHNEQNQGISRTRNVALRQSLGDYIAIIDADDIALPYRLEKQLQTVQRDPSLSGAFSWILQFTTDADQAASFYRPVCDPGDLRERIFFENPLPHSSAFIDRQVMGQGYREDLSCAEDYAKWMELISSGKKFALIEEPLIKFWTHSPTNYTNEKMRLNMKKLHAVYYNQLFGETMSEEENQTHWTLYDFDNCVPADRKEALETLARVDRWLQKLSKLSPRDSTFDHAKFMRFAYGQNYLLASRAARTVGMPVLKFARGVPAVKRLKLFVKSVRP